MRRLLACCVIAFVLGLYVRGLFVPQGRDTVDQPVVLVEPDHEFPDLLRDAEVGTVGPVKRAVDKARFREVVPENVQERPRIASGEVAPNQPLGRPLVPGEGAPQDDNVVPRDSVDRIQQVTKRGSKLVLFVHGDTSDIRVEYDVKGDFDVVARDGLPYMREPRCFVCAPELALEAGMLINEALRKGPHFAAEASVAVLSRDVRLVQRVEVSGEARSLTFIRLKL